MKLSLIYQYDRSVSLEYYYLRHFLKTIYTGAGPARRMYVPTYCYQFIIFCLKTYLFFIAKPNQFV